MDSNDEEQKRFYNLLFEPQQKGGNLVEPMSTTVTPPNKYAYLTTIEDRIKCALEYVLKNKLIPRVFEARTKNETKALELITTGNAAFRKKNFTPALLLYSQAIIHAPVDSQQLYRAYGNRSAAQFELGIYPECLQDIERALEGYENNIKKKLLIYIRRVKAFLAIDNRMRPEVEESIQDARDLIAQADSESQPSLEKLLENVTNINDRNTTFKKSDDSRFMPQTPNSNPIILNGVNAIKLDYSPISGNKVVATRDIAAGETLLVHKAYAAIPEDFAFHTDKMTGKFQFKFQYYEFCGNCTRRAYAGVACRICINVIYCDEKCRDEAWEDHHDIECPVITGLLGASRSTLDMLAIRIFVKAYKETGSFEALKQHIQYIKSKQNTEKHGFTGDVYDCSKFASVYAMLKNIIPDKEVPFFFMVHTAINLAVLFQTSGLFNSQTRLENVLTDKWAPFVGVLLFQSLEICSIRKVEHILRIGTRDARTRAHAILPFLKLFNHSCDPMTTLFTSGKTTALIALRVIKKGEEVCASYGPFFSEKTIPERQNEILEQHLKTSCNCIACLKTWTPYTEFPSYSVSCQEPNANLVYPPIDMAFEEVQMLIRRFSSNLMDDFDQINEMISKITALLNRFGTWAPYPCLQVMKLKSALHFIYQRVQC